MSATPDLAAFEATLARLAAEAGFSGAVAVTRGGERIFAAAYGYANRAWRAPCTLETRFDTASVTKLFTAVAALQLVERRAFGLETPVTGYLELEGTTISPAVTPTTCSPTPRGSPTTPTRRPASATRTCGSTSRTTR